jgi:hypothetical protein
MLNTKLKFEADLKGLLCVVEIVKFGLTLLQLLQLLLLM